MSKRADLPGKEMPTAYQEYSSAMQQGVPFTVFEFTGEQAEVFRFANRFRLARSFTRMELQGYGVRTADGYSALLRVFLVWSALEQWHKIRKNTWPRVEALLPPDEVAKAIRTIRKEDKEDRFVNGLCERCESNKVKQALKDYLEGNNHALIPLVEGVRHTFVHGELSPGLNAASPNVVKRMANIVCPLILRTLDQEFAKRVADGLDRHSNPR